MKSLLWGIFFIVGWVVVGSAQLVKPTFAFDQSGPLRVVAGNSNYVPISLEMTFTTTNVEVSPSKVFNFVLPARSSGITVATLTATGAGASVNYSYRWSRGDYRAVEDDYIYRLPFANSSTFLVSQGEGGVTSHAGSAHNYYAIDFNMPTGTPIHAIREGVVFYVKEDSNLGGASAEFLPLANVVQILHADGTWAEYAHLKQNGASVNVGDTVERGDVIGLSGNTGYTTGPHLHLAVVRNHPIGSSQSISMRFNTTSGTPLVLQFGSAYSIPSLPATAGHPLRVNENSVSWFGYGNLVYQLEMTNGLDAPWAEVNAPVVGRGKNVTVVAGTGSGPCRYFRLRVMQ